MTRKLLTILLISLALCGVQVVQASPLHDHVSHISECSLCHFDGAQAVRTAEPVKTPIPFVTHKNPADLFTHPVTRAFPAYITRAPPQLSI
jgi:hypothetical protein